MKSEHVISIAEISSVFASSPNASENRTESLGISVLAIEANSYTTRHKKELGVTMDNEVIWSAWHSLKGGVKNSLLPGKSNKPEILYDPLTNQWLKMIPIEQPDNNFRSKFSTALEREEAITKISLQSAGLQDLAEKIQLVDIVTKDSKKSVGFVSPHIGFSLEYIFSKALGNRVPAKDSITPSLAAFTQNVYYIAYQEAMNMFFEHGVVIDDINPGNILFSEKAGSLRVVLIDFLGSKFVEGQKGILPSYGFIYQKFRETGKKFGIPFDFNDVFPDEAESFKQQAKLSSINLR